MLKLILPLIFTLLLPSMTKNFWILSTTVLLMLSTYSVSLLPTQIISLSNLSQSIMMDNLCSPLIALSLWITSLMMMASYKEHLNNNKPKMFSIFCIFLCLLLLISFMAHNMIMFYLFFEASLIPTMFLILGWGYQPERLQASMYLILYTVTASLPLLMSILLMYSSPSNLSFLLNQWQTISLSQNLMTIWWLITIAAFLTKMPLYTLHLWLPKAHVEAPVAGSMILAGILLKLGSYGIMRLSALLTYLNNLISPLMMSLSLWGAILTSIICIRQTDLKSLIAYSSIGHMSLLMAGLMSNSAWGWNACLTMMLAHGLCSSSLFSLANSTYESTQTRSIFLTKGLMTLFPTMSMWWFLNCAMNMAAPPTSNLLSEMFLITSSISFSIYTSMPLFLLVFMAAAYSLHLYSSCQHGPTSCFSSPMNLLSQRNYTTTILHLMPATALILKSDTIMLWT